MFKNLAKFARVGVVVLGLAALAYFVVPAAIHDAKLAYDRSTEINTAMAGVVDEARDYAFPDVINNTTLELSQNGWKPRFTRVEIVLNGTIADAWLWQKAGEPTIYVVNEYVVRVTMPDNGMSCEVISINDKPISPMTVVAGIKFTNAWLLVPQTDTKTFVPQNPYVHSNDGLRFASCSNIPIS